MSGSRLCRAPKNPSSPSQLFSDVPRDEVSEKNGSKKKSLDWKTMLPPPPEDQFIMTGDISVLFVYAFTSHYINNFVVESVFSNSQTFQDAINTLDPMGEVVTLQSPVWVNPEMADSVLSMNAQEVLLNHWGPLFSTAGSSCVALCTCWLVAGWFHQAFLYSNSIDCSTSEALTKTCQTWISTALLMGLLVLGTNSLVHHAPFLQTWLGCAACQDYVLTKSDTIFLVDSSTVLIAWRYMANSVANYFRWLPLHFKSEFLLEMLFRDFKGLDALIRELYIVGGQSSDPARLLETCLVSFKRNDEPIHY